MNKEKIAYFKERLVKEKVLLEEELKTVGQRNPNNPEDWEAKRTALDIDQADRNEVADEIEDFENNTSILMNLETRYNEVKNALERIASGTYGICEVSQDEIEDERLEANPAAATCMKHL